MKFTLETVNCLGACALGPVTVIDGRERLLEFCDREVIDTLLYQARSLGMVFRLGESVVDIQQPVAV
jgi:pyruvate/2-oxoglutarate dehydrogenase complex dihydrolipoamide dehydrogenase (E3) component